VKRYAVVGLGNFGLTVARSLYEAGHEVIALDRNETLVDRVAANVTRPVVGDGTDIRLLEKVGVSDADAGIVSTGDDVTASILAALALKDLGVREIYVKVVSRDHARVLEKIGVTETIFPEQESGLRLATRIGSGVLSYAGLAPGFSIQEMAVPESWIGGTLRQLSLPVRHRVFVVAVHDLLRDEMLAVPDPDRTLTESDTLLVAGAVADLQAAARIR
jgi:trk system potassium uptake protein TrkA